MSQADLYKLPLLGHREKLPPLPGQPSADTYAAAWNVWEQPCEGLAYIVKLQPGNKAQVLGLITTNGYVYPTDRPLTELPKKRHAAVAISQAKEDQGGGIYLANDAGRMVRIGDYLGNVENTVREAADAGAGIATWTKQHKSAYRTFMAMLFLHYMIVNPQDGEAAIQASGDTGYPGTLDMALKTLPEAVSIFANFQHMLIPDAIEAALYAINQAAEPSGFEAFAREEFGEIDLDLLRALSTASSMTLARISRNDSFYINFDRSAMTERDVRFILDAEMHLNRVSRVLDLLGCGLSPLTSSPSHETCSALAMRDLTSIGDLVEKVLQCATDQNPWGRPGTITCKPGGTWDVLTRLAQTCERLNLIARLEYGMDYNEAAGSIAITFIPPAAGGQPHRLFDEKTGSWRGLSHDERTLIASEFAARMALVIAAAGFSSGAGIKRCIVDQRAFAGTDRVCRAFDRAAYLGALAPLAARLQAEPLDGGLALRELASFEIDGSALDEQIDPRKVAPREDTRELPQDLRDMLLADRVCDLEVMEIPDDPMLARVESLRADAASDPTAIAGELVQIVEELQAGCVATELMATSPISSQYCENYTTRLALGLNAENRALRINRVPDALYNAQYALANMYFNAGDYENALTEAQRLLDMASTSSGAHFAVINALARLERWEELIDVAKHGMAFASQRDAIAYYFYRIAFAYWALGDLETAAACYRMVPRGENIDQSAQEEMGQLLNQMGLTEPPALATAKATVARAGIEPPPSDALMDFLADAAVRLTDEGFFYLAARCVHEMWRVMGRDELNVIMKSLMS